MYNFIVSACKYTKMHTKYTHIIHKFIRFKNNVHLRKLKQIRLLIIVLISVGQTPPSSEIVEAPDLGVVGKSSDTRSVKRQYI